MSFVSLFTQDNSCYNSNFLNPVQVEKLAQCIEKQKLFSMVHSISSCLWKTEGLEKRYLEFLQNNPQGQIQRTEDGFVFYNKDGSYVTVTFEKNLKNPHGLPCFKVDYTPPSIVYLLGQNLRNGICKVLNYVNTNLVLLNQRIPSLNIFPGAMASSVTQKNEEVFYYTLSEKPEYLEVFDFPSLIPSLIEPRHSYVDYPTQTQTLFIHQHVQENKMERGREVSEDLRNLTQRIREEVEKSQWSKYVPSETKKFCRSFIFQYKNLGHLLEDLSQHQEHSFYSPLVAQSLTLGYSPEDPSMIELWRESSKNREVISFDISSLERLEIEAECADLLYTVVLYEIFPESQALLEPKQEIQYVQSEWEKFKYNIRHDKDCLKNAYLKFFNHLRLRIFYQVRNMYLEHEKIAEKKGIKIRPNKKIGDMITSWTCKLPDGKYFKFKYDHGIKF